MIQEAIQFIASKIESLGIFEKVYSQVELIINTDNKRIPAVYISKGKYKPLDYSANNGTAYLRKASQIQIIESAVETYIGCETYLQFTIPTRLVAFKRKDKLPIDCSYTEDLLAESIIYQLSNNTKDYKQTIKANNFNVLVTAIDTDSNSVWQTEVVGIEQPDVNYDIACVAIDFNIVMIVSPKCLSQICDEPIVDETDCILQESGDELGV